MSENINGNLELSNDDIERFNQIKIFNNGSEIVNDKKENGYKKLDRVKGLQFNFLEFEGHAQNISFNMTFKHIFLTKDELDTELSKIDVKWNPWVEHPFLENLSDSYFEEKVIIAYFYWTSGSNIIRNVDSIYIADDKLIINVINGYESNAVNNDIFLYPILIEVNREDIGCVNDLKINIFGRTVYNYYDFE